MVDAERAASAVSDLLAQRRARPRGRGNDDRAQAMEEARTQDLVVLEAGKDFGIDHWHGPTAHGEDTGDAAEDEARGTRQATVRRLARAARHALLHAAAMSTCGTLRLPPSCGGSGATNANLRAQLLRYAIRRDISRCMYGITITWHCLGGCEPPLPRGAITCLVYCTAGGVQGQVRRVAGRGAPRCHAGRALEPPLRPHLGCRCTHTTHSHPHTAHMRHSHASACNPLIPPRVALSSLHVSLSHVSTSPSSTGLPLHTQSHKKVVYRVMWCKLECIIYSCTALCYIRAVGWQLPA